MAGSTFVRLPRLADSSGDLSPPETAIQFGAGFTLTDAPDVVLGGGAITGATVVEVDTSGAVTSAAVLAALDGQAIAPASVTTTSDVTIGGKLVLGAAQLDPSTAITVGSELVALLSFPLANNSAAVIRIEVIGRAASPVRIAAFVAAISESIESGTPRTVGSGVILSKNEFGLPVSAASLSWLAGVATISVAGPGAFVTGTAAGGGGRVRLTFAGGIDDSIDGVSVVVSGVGGTTEADGTWVAIKVDATHIELTGSTWANAWTIGGFVALDVEPTIAWSCLATAVVTPAP